MYVQENYNNFIEFQNFSGENISNFIKDFNTLNIHEKIEEFTDPNDSFTVLHKAIIELKEKHFPVCKVKFNKYKHKRHKWITNGLLRSIKFRDKLFARLRKCPKNSDMYDTLRTNLRTYNRILKSSIRVAKSDFYHTIFEKYKFNMKQTWVHIKDLVNTKKTNDFPEFFMINELKVSDPKTLAQSFNEYFNNIGPIQASSIICQSETNFRNYLTNFSETKFKFHPVTDENIEKIISTLAPKSSAGKDGLSVKFLKLIQKPLISPLTKVVNQTIRSGIFPNFLKIAKIIPCFKKGEKHKIENYRPISILPAISKIFEKVMLDQLQNYFNENKLYFDGQYGFRKGLSTEYAVMENVDRIVDFLESDKMPFNIYIDLTKAFDTINHSILLEKLSYYGVQGQSYNLCYSYLNNRYQYVSFMGQQSELLHISTGVPQGSILGPFFFLVYINDFHRSSNVFNFTVYADDTTLLGNIDYSETAIPKMEKYLNDELQNISNWLKANKLALNIDKTCFMIFHSANKKVMDLSLKIDGVEIKRVSHFNFLGINLHENLTWKSHVEKIGMKIKKVIAISNRLKYYLPCETLLTIYNSLIMSRLLYGVCLWGQQSSYITKLQKKAIRNISKSKYNAHTEPIFKNYNILKFEHLNEIQNWKFYYKFIHNAVPVYFRNWIIPTHSDIHSHETRGSHKYVPPRLKYNISTCTIKNRIPSLVNKSIWQVKGKLYTHSLKGFVYYLKQTFVSSYSSYCNIENCYVCNSECQ